jgi:hypothetical protein
MRYFLPIVCLMALAVSCHRGLERIPRRDMEEIMMQVLLQDQYVKQHSENRRQYDTVLVYEGIFEDFGYDTDDFLTSLEYYLEDPSRMAKIMESVETRLTARLPEIEKELEEFDWRQGYMRIWSLRPELSRLPQPSFTSALDTLYIQFVKDSLFYHPLSE